MSADIGLPSDTATTRRLRQRMVRDQLPGSVRAGVRQAMATVPRHQFVPGAPVDLAYGDHPVPIGAGQTISQPLVVAEMLSVLALEPGEQAVLDVGSGCGYTAALLAHLVGERGIVHAVERHASLREGSRAALDAHTGGGGAAPVVLHPAGPVLGAPEHGPYVAIHVACAGPVVPAALLDQLAPGGRMILPVGPVGGVQDLVLVEPGPGGWQQRVLFPVRFVPLVP